jgi:hypothetical protein
MTQADSYSAHGFMVATALDNGEDIVATARGACMELDTGLLPGGIHQEHKEIASVRIGLSNKNPGLIDPAIAVEVSSHTKVSRPTKVGVNSEIGLQNGAPTCRILLGERR